MLTMEEQASFDGPPLPISSRTSARGRSFELSLIFGKKVAAVLTSLGEATTTTRRAATELAGLFNAFEGSTLIGILFEQLEGDRVRTFDGPGGLRRAGRVSGSQVAVVDGPAGGASERHEHWHVSFQMLRALRTADQCMIRGSSGSYRAAPHDAMPCDAMPAMRCRARAREGRGGLKPPLDPIVSTM